MKKIITKSALAVAVLLALPACDAVEKNSKQDTLLNDSAQFCSATLDKAQLQLDDFRKAYTNPNKIPTSFSDGKVNFITPMGWTSGFVAGSFWYMYEHSQDKSWLDTATHWTNALEDMQFNRKTHDVGFIMNNSFGNGLRLTGNKNYSPILVSTAQTLMERYNPNIGATFSWSWGTWEFPVIIDNMMNLELLFNASLATGDKKYYDAAVSHATVTMEHHFRDDYSSYHLVNYSRDTGLPQSKQTFQGLTDDSSWSRGQAWGAYGYTMVYRYTKDEKFLNHARNIVNYLLSHKNMPEDLVPYFDYDAPEHPDVVNYRDSSAASLLASGLLELANYVEKEEAARYRKAAMKMLHSLSSPEYLAEKGENGHFLLKQATGNYPAGKELNAALNYGDYYYLEALNRCKNTI
ncbi:glycoside hydrolase family 88 protein [Pseudoalteromonas sp. SR43-2]|uniref:glycoside hydrolase family 88 protein n=1 Tax=Pseudoalteromonas sp. SR43-2 TaxID=2760944 RepID=UPI0015FAF15A|nr:glycoside hydrolase family 88 protein [Pseudoalteromonas sp. SR43-2]MBB1379337.1 glycoside hydrolase family 88 protein [Pseudoalteromonas sp. SR43-2]